MVHVHYITARYKSKNYNLYSKKGAHELRGSFLSLLEDSRTEGAGTSRPAPRDKLDPRWMAPLQSKLQNLNMQVQGSQELPNKYSGECQVSCKDKYMCVDKIKQ